MATIGVGFLSTETGCMKGMVIMSNPISKEENIAAWLRVREFFLKWVDDLTRRRIRRKHLRRFPELDTCNKRLAKLRIILSKLGYE